MAAYEIGSRVDMFQVRNVGQDGYGSGDRPVVFLNSSQIFRRFIGDKSAETNCLRSLLAGGLETLLRYFAVFLARALVPSTIGKHVNPMPAPDSSITRLS
jgi:hypothetical protein